MARPRKLIPESLDVLNGTYTDGDKSIPVVVLVVEHAKGIAHIPFGPETARTLAEVLMQFAQSEETPAT
jgi:hypothetical protein